MSPNRLAKEKSLYLRQHADNPVDWYPWGEEAFQKARMENKPLLLSIGYSSCHWCHVMERESFSDPRIAKLINENFVAVKVDREERPDVDEVYMRAVQMMTGTGGWPLTVFLTPELKPFYGGTYFPPRRRGGMVGFDEVLQNIATTWRKSGGDLARVAEETASVLRQLYTHRPAGAELNYSHVGVAYEMLVSVYDEVYGGFGGAPKFPMPTYLSLLHMIHYRDGERYALRMSLNTLEKMARGGIFDQLAGGFHRYSTDRSWLIPHFEKMLYDNALLTIAYLEAYLLTGNQFMGKIAAMTLDWMLREMRSSEGGFYSSVDADTDEGEGLYYTWTSGEVKELLGEELGEAICWLFSITKAGNFEKGRTVLTLPRDPAEVASRYGIPLDKLEEARMALLRERERRPKPAVDQKIIASWNGLTISALSKAFQVLGDRRYLESAVKAAEHILSSMWRGGRLSRTLNDGVASNEGTLEDYAYLTYGLLNLFESSFQPKFLRASIELAETMDSLFWDNVGHGYFYSLDEVGGIARIKYGYDGVMPSGNSMAALTMLRLYEYTGEAKYLDRVTKTLQLFNDDMMQNPLEYTTMLKALAYYLGPRTEVIIVGGEDEVQKMLDVVYPTYHPMRVVLVLTPTNASELLELAPVARGKERVDDKTTAYVCENYTCRFPVTTAEELRELFRDAR
ncbi:MAG: thioredoxin domain-containing protein [Nitrososphaerota archaeon]